MNHLERHIHHTHLRSDNTLHVIGVISNPMRYQSRIRLFRAWFERMKKTANVEVYVVEVAYGDRSFEVTDPNDPKHLQLRSRGHKHIWNKENLINLGVKHLLPRDWKYLCWSDCDVFWPTDCEGKPIGWALEAIHQLQLHSVIQPWKDAIDLGFHGDVGNRNQSFCYAHHQGIKKTSNPKEPYVYGHPGFAWCVTRAFWEAVGGLMDFHVVGSADFLMAWCLINEVENKIHNKFHEGFRKRILEWQRRAYRFTLGNLGYVRTRIEHGFHGSKVHRKYWQRNSIIIDHKINPDTDLTYDAQGLIQFINQPFAEQEIGKYMLSRNEDSIDE